MFRKDLSTHDGKYTNCEDWKIWKPNGLFLQEAPGLWCGLKKKRPLLAHVVLCWWCIWVRLWNLEKAWLCWRKYITGDGQALRVQSLALHPILLLCFLGVARNVISVLLLPPCFPCLLSCLPLHNGLYFSAIISQAKSFSLRLALAIAFYHSNRKKLTESVRRENEEVNNWTRCLGEEILGMPLCQGSESTPRSHCGYPRH